MSKLSRRALFGRVASAAVAVPAVALAREVPAVEKPDPEEFRYTTDFGYIDYCTISLIRGDDLYIGINREPLPYWKNKI